jgi:hypothetical protein
MYLTTEQMNEYIALRETHVRLLQAVRAVYYVGTWHCDELEYANEEALWEQLRDAAGFEPGGTSRD